MIKFAVLVRHGESITNTMGIVSDDIDKYPLSEKGIKQARFVGNELKKINVDGILTSPILRARHTAEIISSVLQKEIKIDQRLREIGFGRFNNGPFSITPKFTYESDEIEAWTDIEKRMLSVMNDYNGNLILVSHAFPIRVIIAHFLNLDENESFGISLGNASISVIDIINKKVLAIGSPIITENLMKSLKEK
jgi:Fructose-2,6-bisphosphatase